MSLNLNALFAFPSTGRAASKAAAIWISDPLPTKSVVAFGNLVDLARRRLDTSSGEICDVCNTINFGRLHYCKGCSRKLPAFYAACEGEAQPRLPRLTSFIADRASLTDFAAFVLVVNLLVGVAEVMSLQ